MSTIIVKFLPKNANIFLEELFLNKDLLFQELSVLLRGDFRTFYRYFPRNHQVYKKEKSQQGGWLYGRVNEIRTHDPLHPMQVRYQTAL